MEFFVRSFNPVHIVDLPIHNSTIEQINNGILVQKTRILLNCNSHINLKVFTQVVYKSLVQKQNIPNENVKEILCSGDVQLPVFKQTIECFCKQTSVAKNKVIVLYSIDNLAESFQETLIALIDTFSVHVVSSCTKVNKLSQRFKNRFNIIPNIMYQSEKINCIFENLVHLNNIRLTNEAKEYILNITGHCVETMDNCIHKLKLIGCNEYNIHDVKEFCGVIDTNMFDDFTYACLSGDYTTACKIMQSVDDNGYPVIDMLELYFTYIKICTLGDNIKTVIITVISKYISHFYLIQENSIDLFFFTFELIDDIETFLTSL